MGIINLDLVIISFVSIGFSGIIGIGVGFYVGEFFGVLIVFFTVFRGFCLMAG